VSAGYRNVGDYQEGKTDGVRAGLPTEGEAAAATEQAP
jgi:hypothetical protein